LRLTTPAWVLRRVRWSESSLIVALYSLDSGRMSAMARGALRPDSRFAGSLELFSLVEVGVSRRDGRELDTLTDVCVGEPSACLMNNPLAFGFASLWSEWVMALLIGNEPSQPSFHLTGAVFRLLAAGAPGWPVVCSGVEKLLRLSGLRMETEHCTRCGNPAGASTTWNHPSGGAVCSSCAAGPGDVDLPPGIVGFLRMCQKTPLEGVQRTRLWKGGFRQCHDFLRDFAEAHVQSRLRFRSLAVLEDLENGLR
jgi:DNA repair protein RecO (recombination protein O)